MRLVRIPVNKLLDVFNDQVLYLLRKHIRLPHLRPPPLIRPLLVPPPAQSLRSQQSSVKFHAEMTAAALYNSIQRQDKLRANSILSIVTRINESLRLAKYIHRKAPQDYEHNVLLRRLCAAASVSWYCHQYMYTPRLYHLPTVFKGHRTTDLHLEISLLVACGYPLEDVKNMLILLARKGLLHPYTGYHDDRSRYKYQPDKRIGMVMHSHAETTCRHDRYEYCSRGSEGITRGVLDSWEGNRVQLEREVEHEYEAMRMDEVRKIARRQGEMALRRMTREEREEYKELTRACRMPCNASSQ